MQKVDLTTDILGYTQIVHQANSDAQMDNASHQADFYNTTCR